MTRVILRASGYTWKCPECDRENYTGPAPDMVQCEQCNGEFEVKELHQYQLTPALHSSDNLKDLQSGLDSKVLNVHIKIDTGLEHRSELLSECAGQEPQYCRSSGRTRRLGRAGA